MARTTAALRVRKTAFGMLPVGVAMCDRPGCEFLSDAPFFGLSLWTECKAGKLRMREWVELFDEPRPSFEVLAISELPSVICRCIELLALFWQGVMYTVK